MTEPTDAELDELRQANGGKLNFVTLREFRTIARAVLAKWGTQPVACEPLTDSQPQAGAVPMSHEDAKALILQLVEALEYSSPHTDREYQWNPKDWIKRRADAITAGRAWLEGAP